MIAKKEYKTLLLLSLAFLVVYSLVWKLLTPFLEADANRYLNLAIARSSQPFVANLLNLQGVVEYPNAVFVFLISLAYKFGGESASLLLVPVAGLLFVLCFYLCLREYLSPQLAAALSLIPFIAPPLNHHLLQFCPNGISVALSLLCILALLKDAPVGAFVAALFATWGASNAFIPIWIVAAFLFIKAKKDSRLSVAGLSAAFGILVAALMNPSTFSIFLKLKSLLALMEGADPTVPFVNLGFLHSGMSTKQWMGLSPFVVGVLLVAGTMIFSPTWVRGDRRSKKPSLSFFAVLTSGLWIAVLWSSEAVDLAIPLSIAIVGAAMEEGAVLPLFQPLIKAVFALFVPALILQTFSSGNVSSDTATVLSAASSIPKVADDKTVFACENDTAKLLLYARPDLKIVGLFESDWLPPKEKKSQTLRESILKSEISFPFMLVRDFFSSRFVVCNDKTAQKVFDRDPQFSRVNLSEPAIYEVNAKILPNFVREYNLSKVINAPEKVTTTTLLEEAHWLKADVEKESPYVFPIRWLSEDRSISSDNGCALAAPNLAGVADLSSYEMLGVGGYHFIKVFVNGSLLVSKVVPEENGRGVRFLVSLPKHLSHKDEVLMLVCDRSARKVAMALSFWKKEELRQFCRGKKVAPEYLTSDQDEDMSCIGQILATTSANS